MARRIGVARSGLLGKLALGLLLACFIMAGTNWMMYTSVVLNEEQRRDRVMIDSSKSKNRKVDIDSHTTSRSNHNPTNLFQQQKKKVDTPKASAPDTSQITSPKESITAKPIGKPPGIFDHGIYKCTYGSSKEGNRTSVIAPKHEPTFIIIGVQKSGTTSLLSHFRDHPQVLQTKHSLRREAHFFDTSWNTQVIKQARKMNITQYNDKHCLALQQYMKLFETETMMANSQSMPHGKNPNSTDHLPLYTFEKTPTYFNHPKIPSRIRLAVPWSKIVLILRDPIDRLYSHYKMTVKTNFGLRKYSLEDFIYHELKAMKRFNMTTASLMEPVNVTEGNDDTDKSIPVIADHYQMPKNVPYDHAILDPEKWNPKTQAIINKPDSSKLSFHNLVRRGLYSIQLRWWLNFYSIDRDLLVINYDDLLKDTRSVFERVCDFAGIPLPYDTARNQTPADVGIDFGRKNRADKDKDERPLKNETRRFLSEFYAPYTAELQELLGPEWHADKLGWT